MNKKKIFILSLASITSFAVIASVALAASVDNSESKVKAENELHTLTVDSSTAGFISAGNFRAVTSDGNQVMFTYPKGSVSYGSLQNDTFLQIKGKSSVTLAKETGIYHAITGIESIKVNFYRMPNYIDSPKLVEAGQDGDLSVEYGYVDTTNNLVYGAPRSLSVNAECDLSDVSPRYFRLSGTQNSPVAVLIKSIVVKYTCDQSRTDIKVLEEMAYSSFSNEPTMPDPSHGFIYSYGMYPQSLASNSEYLETEYQNAGGSWTPLTSGYYYYQGGLYARLVAANSGYNSEYVVGKAYWFNVEPVLWYQQNMSTISGVQTAYLLSQYILTNHEFGSNSTNKFDNDESNSLCTYMNGEFFDQLFPTNEMKSYISSQTKDSDTIKIDNKWQDDSSDVTDRKLFPYSHDELSGTYNGRSFPDAEATTSTSRSFEPTDYCRATAYDSTYQLKNGTNVVVGNYWLRSKRPAQSVFFYISSRYGQYVTGDATSKLGVLPSLKYTRVVE